MPVADLSDFGKLTCLPSNLQFPQLENEEDGACCIGLLGNQMR